MNRSVFDKICEILDVARINYKVLDHHICRTSSESALARAERGFPCIGAKALLMRIERHSAVPIFGVMVLPGPSKLDSRAARNSIRETKRLRFATPEELQAICGVVPGALPPFGRRIFPQVERLYIDKGISSIETIGFNAAGLERSIILRTSDYLAVAQPDEILTIGSEAVAA